MFAASKAVNVRFFGLDVMSSSVALMSLGSLSSIIPSCSNKSKALAPFVGSLGIKISLPSGISSTESYLSE